MKRLSVPFQAIILFAEICNEIIYYIQKSIGTFRILLSQAKLAENGARL